MVVENDDCWTFRLKELYELDPAKAYSFVFKFAKCQLTGFLSSQTKLNLDIGEESFVFTLNFEKPHCIEQLVFLALV